jgi:hypothetical protein
MLSRFGAFCTSRILWASNHRFGVGRSSSNIHFNNSSHKKNSNDNNNLNNNEVKSKNINNYSTTSTSNNSDSKITSKTNAKRRSLSYLEQLRCGNRTLVDANDAQRLFRQLLKHRNEPVLSTESIPNPLSPSFLFFSTLPLNIPIQTERTRRRSS